MRGVFVAAAATLVIWFAARAHAEQAAIGDSLAVGTGQALGIETIAKVGASSCAILQTIPSRHFTDVVISAGTNDPPGRCAEAIRGAIHADRVVWILPVNGARANIEAVAFAHGDKTISYTPGNRPVWPHPRSYGPLAAAVRAAF